ncbi:hypothetical protein NGRA_0077 [Nosema granulosis]|uniref:Uncharacterized protein n=1 Tax=Nosema granulosis TaxID=83296 RepID=A0A9P6L0E2_9MICR|nr:hypothetical protein NGRA_0077 [Nosema granulosis]
MRIIFLSLALISATARIETYPRCMSKLRGDRNTKTSTKGNYKVDPLTRETSDYYKEDNNLRLTSPEVLTVPHKKNKFKSTLEIIEEEDSDSCRPPSTPKSPQPDDKIAQKATSIEVEKSPKGVYEEDSKSDSSCSRMAFFNDDNLGRENITFAKMIC